MDKRLEPRPDAKAVIQSGFDSLMFSKFLLWLCRRSRLRTGRLLIDLFGTKNEPVWGTVKYTRLLSKIQLDYDNYRLGIYRSIFAPCANSIFTSRLP